MSKSAFILFVIFTVTVSVIDQTVAKTTGRRVKRQDMTSELGDYPLNDVDMMQRVFQTPLKRQWCRSGMSYNPVLGSCTLSLAAMRGRGRGYRGV